jgi:hypothetical protein
VSQSEGFDGRSRGFLVWGDQPPRWYRPTAADVAELEGRADIWHGLLVRHEASWGRDLASDNPVLDKKVVDKIARGFVAHEKFYRDAACVLAGMIAGECT